jgi:hypothetical protein
MDLTNLERANNAQAACDLYGSLTGMTVTEDRESLLGDLVADILHLAVRLNIEPDRVVRLGQMHFTEEQEEEQ